MNFYSARLLYIILVDDGKPKCRNHFDESIIVFRAKDYQSAFRRALKLGKARETDYRNDKKQRVRWALVDILNLDLIGKKVDGCEVASHLHYRTQATPISAKKRFKPEKSKPEESF